MKKFFIAMIVLWFAAIVNAQSTNTPNIQLQIPATGSNNWSVPLNYNFTKLDLLLSGNLPIPALSVSGNVSLPGLTLTSQQIQNAIGYTPLNPANNLNDVSNKTSAFTNLTSGLGCTSSAPLWNFFNNTCVANSGGGSTPGGALTSVQFNNSGALGGTTIAKAYISGPLSGQLSYSGYPIASPFTKHYAWGDSLTYGAYTSSLFNAYPYWIAGHYNLTLPHDEGVSGATTNSANAIIFNAAPQEDGGTLNTYMLGTNDSRLSSGSTDLATDYLWALESELAYISLPNANKILGANFGTTGSWSAGNWPTIGIKSTTSGATATFTTVKGSTVLVDTTIPSAANAGTATLACDGTATGATLNFQYSGSTAPGTLGYNTALTIVSGLANTTHTCVVTVTSSSGTVELNWAAAIDPTNLVNYPVTFAADIIPQNQTPDYSSIYSPNVSTAVNALAAIGLNVHLVDTYSLFTPPTYYVDALHVTGYGYFTIANAFNNAIDTYLGLNPTYPNIAWQGMAVYNNAVSAGDLAIGYQSQNNTAETGTNNTTIGNTTMPNATTAQQNICIGNASCNALTTGGNNVAVGLSALSHAAATSNSTAVGEGALATDNSVGNNTGVGTGACSQNATGVNNVCIGYDSGVYTHFLTQSNGIVLVGSQASLLNADTSAAFTNTTVMGFSALGGASEDTVVGAAAQAGAQNCIALGFGANCSTANTAVIGNSQITGISLGNGDVVVTKPGGTIPGPTITPVGSNTTAASCATGWTCTNAQGLITVTIASTYTPGGLALVTFGANAYPNTATPNCMAAQAGGTVDVLPYAGGSGSGTPPTYTAFYLKSDQNFAILGANTYNIAYWCSTQ